MLLEYPVPTGPGLPGVAAPTAAKITGLVVYCLAFSMLQTTTAAPPSPAAEPSSTTRMVRMSPEDTAVTSGTDAVPSFTPLVSVTNLDELVNKVVAKDELMAEAVKLAQEFAEGPVAISFAKHAINKASDLSANDAMEVLSRLYGDVYKTNDAKEGITAYIERRKPNFNGK